MLEYFKIGVNRKNVLILLFFYKVALDLCYFFVVAEKYASYGFRSNSSGIWLLISWMLWLVYVFITLRVYKRELRFAEIVLFIWIFISYIPFTTLVCAGILSLKYVFLNSIYTVFFSILVIVFDTKKIGNIKLKLSRNCVGKICAPKILCLIGLLSVLTVIYVSYQYTGFRLRFSLENVYDLRLEAREYDLSAIMKYFLSWTKIINCFMLAYCILNRQKILTGLFLIVQVISFGIDGSKTTIFMPAVVFGCILLYKNGAFVKFKMLFVTGITMFPVISLLEYIMFGSYKLVAYFIRRMFFIPVFLGNVYVDFFSFHQPDYFRSSFLRFFGFQSPYPNLGRSIGEIYFNSPDMNCNNGMISDAVTNMGIAGIIFMPLLLFVLFRMMDCFRDDLYEGIFVILGIYYALTLLNTFLMTTLLTHGLLVAIFLLIIIKRESRLKLKKEP